MARIPHRMISGGSHSPGKATSYDWKVPSQVIGKYRDKIGM
jgi:hypothetical protein